jgi:hypothetical protein
MLAALSGYEHWIARFFKFCDLDQQQLQTIKHTDDLRASMRRQ